ncbi:MAG: DEAD/DEAH box helicase [Candidatus Bipolaricaulota bacterium]
MPDIPDLIEGLKDQSWFRDQLEHLETVPAQKAQYKPPEVDLHPDLEEWLEDRDMRLYSHQARAIKLLKGGSNVVITTPTASGKTLAFNLPVLDSLLTEPDARALYIYPTKALANDQLNILKEIDSDLDTSLNPCTYDGDTPRAKRPQIRVNSRIILTNPYALHRYLPWHDKWADFYSDLQFTIIDEVHRYRGVFGSNVATLIRRFQRICNFYGSDPQFVLSSATVANPEEHSQRLIGQTFKLVSQDGSPTGKKYFLFWNSTRDPDTSSFQQTSRLLSYLTNKGAQTLCFTPSRRMAEMVARSSDKRTPHQIYTYRAGYLPQERREIEKGLKSGEIRGAASTNALELGVDIGGLDAVIISGYPGTVISTWQQAGRAGRGQEEALAILVGFENPLDQYFMRHPQKFFGKPHENSIIDLQNPHIVFGSLLCAAAELPIRSGEALFTKYQEELNSLEERNLLTKTPLGYAFSGTGSPVEAVQLDNIGDQRIEVIDKMKGKILETMDRTQAYREAHPGSALLHQGEKYLVEDLDLENEVATVTKKEIEYNTDPFSETTLKIEKLLSKSGSWPAELKFGEVKVTEKYLGYKVKEYGQVVNIHSLDLPPLDFKTEALWITFLPEVLQKLRNRSLDPSGGLHGLEHALIAATPIHAMCARRDIGGLSSIAHGSSNDPIVFLYDSYEGGIGIAEKCYGVARSLFQTTYELVKDCECKGGCPSCIYSPQCGNDNQPLDKTATLSLLDQLRNGR